MLKKDLPTKRQNWVMQLSEFNYNIIHRKGVKNGNADFFSRMRTSGEEESFYEEVIDEHVRKFGAWSEQDQLDEATKQEPTRQAAVEPEDGVIEEGDPMDDEPQMIMLEDAMADELTKDGTSNKTPSEELSSSAEAQAWLAQKQRSDGALR